MRSVFRNVRLSVEWHEVVELYDYANEVELTNQSTFEPFSLSDRDLMDDPVRWQVLDATP